MTPASEESFHHHKSPGSRSFLEASLSLASALITEIRLSPLVQSEETLDVNERPESC